MTKWVNWQALAASALGIVTAAPLAPHVIMLEFSRDVPGTLAVPIGSSVGLCAAVILLVVFSIRKRSGSLLFVLALGSVCYMFSLRFITFNAANAEVTEYFVGMPIRRVEFKNFNDEIYCISSSLLSLSFVSKASGGKFETFRGIWPAYLNDKEIALRTAAIPLCSIAR
ncbi:hypothetical protein [Massilia sp. erpn]|uniref:hypothetical protein n=1 Tax=Massilia sp. erpn TaxID=2738142 RepID=UPI002106089B|nr:hypothetical protein [Massilia sp. erpn]UTY58796.1 hypothetical protein HPQ68_17310 [Massilia sp. erpn]